MSIQAGNSNPPRAPAEDRARVLDHPSHEEENPDAALPANCGLGRKAHQGAGDTLRAETVYLEITPP
jgi:hypothetical protein